MKAQHGSALIIGLILLLALTVLGVAGMNMSRTELAMTANLQFYNAGKTSALAQLDLNMDQTRIVLEQALTGQGLDTSLNSADGTWASRTVGTSAIPGGNFTINGSMVARHFEFMVDVDEAVIPLDHRVVQGAYLIGPGN